jgi:hypothetical protein
MFVAPRKVILKSSALCTLRSALCALRSALCALRSAPKVLSWLPCGTGDLTTTAFVHIRGEGINHPFPSFYFRLCPIYDSLSTSESSDRSFRANKRVSLPGSNGIAEIAGDLRLFTATGD